MGLLLSVLVVCVGVLEVLACVRHFQDGYLPLWTPHCAVTSGYTASYERWRKKPSGSFQFRSFDDVSGPLNPIEDQSIDNCLDTSRSTQNGFTGKQIDEAQENSNPSADYCCHLSKSDIRDGLSPFIGENKREVDYHNTSDFLASPLVSDECELKVINNISNVLPSNDRIISAISYSEDDKTSQDTSTPEFTCDLTSEKRTVSSSSQGGVLKSHIQSETAAPTLISVLDSKSEDQFSDAVGIEKYPISTREIEIQNEVPILSIGDELQSPPSALIAEQIFESDSHAGILSGKHPTQDDCISKTEAELKIPSSNLSTEKSSDTVRDVSLNEVGKHDQVSSFEDEPNIPFSESVAEESSIAARELHQVPNTEIQHETSPSDFEVEEPSITVGDFEGQIPITRAETNIPSSDLKIQDDKSILGCEGERASSECGEIIYKQQDATVPSIENESAVPSSVLNPELKTQISSLASEETSITPAEVSTENTVQILSDQGISNISDIVPFSSSELVDVQKGYPDSNTYIETETCLPEEITGQHVRADICKETEVQNTGIQNESSPSDFEVEEPSIIVGEFEGQIPITRAEPNIPSSDLKIQDVKSILGCEGERASSECGEIIYKQDATVPSIENESAVPSPVLNPELKSQISSLASEKTSITPVEASTENTVQILSDQGISTISDSIPFSSSELVDVQKGYPDSNTYIETETCLPEEITGQHLGADIRKETEVQNTGIQHESSPSDFEVEEPSITVGEFEGQIPITRAETNIPSSDLKIQDDKSILGCEGERASSECGEIIYKQQDATVPSIENESAVPPSVLNPELKSQISSLASEETSITPAEASTENTVQILSDQGISNNSDIPFSSSELVDAQKGYPDSNTYIETETYLPEEITGQHLRADIRKETEVLISRVEAPASTCGTESTTNIEEGLEASQHEHVESDSFQKHPITEKNLDLQEDSTGSQHGGLGSRIEPHTSSPDLQSEKQIITSEYTKQDVSESCLDPQTTITDLTSRSEGTPYGDDSGFHGTSHLTQPDVRNDISDLQKPSFTSVTPLTIDTSVESPVSQSPLTIDTSFETSASVTPLSTDHQSSVSPPKLPSTPKKSKADISWPTFFPGTPVIKRPSVSFATPEAIFADEFQELLRQHVEEVFTHPPVKDSEDVSTIIEPETTTSTSEDKSKEDKSVETPERSESFEEELGPIIYREKSPSNIVSGNDFSKKELKLQRRRSYKQKRYNSATEISTRDEQAEDRSFSENSPGVTRASSLREPNRRHKKPAKASSFEDVILLDIKTEDSHLMNTAEESSAVSIPEGRETEHEESQQKEQRGVVEGTQEISDVKDCPRIPAERNEPKLGESKPQVEEKAIGKKEAAEGSKEEEVGADDDYSFSEDQSSSQQKSPPSEAFWVSSEEGTH